MDILRVVTISTHSKLLLESINSGTLWFVENTNQIFFDNDTVREEYGNIRVFNTDADRLTYTIGLTDGLIDGVFYYVKSTNILWTVSGANWVAINPIQEAPLDGEEYVRRNGAWSIIDNQSEPYEETIELTSGITFSFAKEYDDKFGSFTLLRNGIIQLSDTYKLEDDKKTITLKNFLTNPLDYPEYFTALFNVRVGG